MIPYKYLRSLSRESDGSLKLYSFPARAHNYSAKFLLCGGVSLYASVRRPFYTAQAHPAQSLSCRVLVSHLNVSVGQDLGLVSEM